jgi:hypothetical protein
MRNIITGPFALLFRQISENEKPTYTHNSPSPNPTTMTTHPHTNSTDDFLKHSARQESQGTGARIENYVLLRQ